jgi:putative PIN family toxin of toxin-antitoxin system
VRAVLDPNVLVSALISPAGPPAQILSAWVQERFELVVSPLLLAEAQDVLARPKLRRWVSHAAAQELVQALHETAILADDPPAQAGLTPDPDDDYLIDLASSADVAYLVSGEPTSQGSPTPGHPSSHPGNSWTCSTRTTSPPPERSISTRTHQARHSYRDHPSESR